MVKKYVFLDHYNMPLDQKQLKLFIKDPALFKKKQRTSCYILSPVLKEVSEASQLPKELSMDSQLGEARKSWKDWIKNIIK